MTWWPPEVWGEIGRRTWPIGPEFVKYCLRGTTLGRYWEDCTP